MKITGPDMLKQAWSLWPDLFQLTSNQPGNIVFADATYWMPTELEVHDMLLKTYMDQYDWTSQVFDCDDFALVLHAWVVQERYRKVHAEGKDESTEYPWALGQAWGSMFHGDDMTHAVNVVWTRDNGVMLIDAAVDMMWKAEHGQDDIYWLRM